MSMIITGFLLMVGALLCLLAVRPLLFIKDALVAAFSLWPIATTIVGAVGTLLVGFIILIATV